MFIVKFPVIVVLVYAVTSEVNEDEYKMGAGNVQGEVGAGVIVRLPATALRRIVDEIVSRRPTRNGHVYRPPGQHSRHGGEDTRRPLAAKCEWTNE